MINEDFVTYDQAVKLKELGFDWECNHYYDSSELLHEECQSFVTNYGHTNSDLCLISAPTLSQAQKWLREVKGVKVYIKPLFSSDEYEYCISFKFQGFNVGDECYGVEETWEYALSEGINEAIKLLKKEEQRNKRWYE